MNGFLRTLAAATLGLACFSLAAGQDAQPGPISKIILVPVDDLLKPKEPTRPVENPAPETVEQLPPILIPTSTNLLDTLVSDRMALKDAELKGYMHAAGYFDYADAAEAKAKLSSFLTTFPKSVKAPEMIYRLAVLDLAANESAKATFQRLIREAPTSPWAKLAMQTHLDQDGLMSVANAIRKFALDANNRDDGVAAILAYKAVMSRFGKGKTNLLRECVYKVIDCYTVIEQPDEATEALQLLVKADDDKNGWVALARIRASAPGQEAESLTKLSKLTDAREEAARVFVTIYEQCATGLKGEDAVRHRYHYAQCLLQLEKNVAATATLRDVATNHPKTTWAADATLDLAEQAFGKKRWQEAQDLYRRLARDYPEHKHARAAAIWAQAVDQSDATSAAIGEALFKTFQTWNESSMQMSVRATCRDAEKQLFMLDLAYRDPEHYRAEVVLRDAGMILASNAKNTFLWDRHGPVKIAAKALKLPMPMFNLKIDPKTESLAFWFAFDSEATQPKFDIETPRELAKLAGRSLCERYHTWTEPADPIKKTPQRFVVEFTHDRDPYLTRIEIILDAVGRIASARVTNSDPEQKNAEIVFDQILFGSEIPLARFAPIQPANVGVVHVAEINPLVLMGQAFQMGSDMMNVLAAWGKQ